MKSADIALHEGLAVACARRFLHRGAPMEDLLQEARAALCAAQRRFDPSRGLQFSTYAVPVVLGALRAYCRRLTPMHVPRADLQLLGRLQADADGTGLGDEQALAAAQRMQRMTADPELAALAREEGFEERVLLRDAVRRLGPPFAVVIGLRYLCGLTQQEVGQRLGAPQWQVSRWEKAGLERRRGTMGMDG